jgi:DNA-binding transcriptional MerR regulator
MGLVEPPRRTDGRVRYYEKSDLKRFKFVLKLKELGLSLEEMKDLADIYTREQMVPKIMPRLIELLDTHLKSIKEKVTTLQSLDKDITAYRQRIIDEYNLITNKPPSRKSGTTTAKKAQSDAAVEPPKTTGRKAVTPKG